MASSNLAAAKAAIEAVVTTAAGSLPVAKQNVSFTPPVAGTAWIRSYIIFGSSSMLSGGSGASGNQTTGVLMLSVFGPKGEGLGDLFTVVDTLRTAFSRVKIGAAFFYSPSGPTEIPDDSYSHLSISCPFDIREA